MTTYSYSLPITSHVHDVLTYLVHLMKKIYCGSATAI